MFPAEFENLCQSASFGCCITVLQKNISEANYASNQSPTSRVLAISYFFLYFVNVVLNSNEKVHRGFLCVCRSKGEILILIKAMIINFNSVKISHLKFQGQTQPKRKGINRWIWYIACIPITTVLILSRVKWHTATQKELTNNIHLTMLAGKPENLLSATQNSPILILQLAFRPWSKCSCQIKNCYWL